jgi:GGDEF domain-containing protein
VKKKSNLTILLSITLILTVVFTFLNIKKNGSIIYESFKEKQMTILKNSMNVYIDCLKERVEAHFNVIYHDINPEKLNKDTKEEYLDYWKKMQYTGNFINTIAFKNIETNFVLKKNVNEIIDSKLFDDKYINITLDNPPEIIWNSSYIDSQSKNFIVPLSKGIWDTKGKLKGVLVVDFNMDSFNNRLSRLNFPEGTILLLLNKNNELISYNSKTPIFKTYKEQEWYQNIINLDSGHLKTSDGTDVTFYSNTEWDWKLIAITPSASIKIYKREINISILLILGVSLATLFVTYELITSTINKRNKEIITSIRHLRETNHHDIDIHLKKLIKKDNLYNEVYDEILKLTAVEKNLYKDADTGLYNKEYLNLNNAKWGEKDYNMLIVQYKNLQNIRNIYGSGIVDLVVKRGALTLKNSCEEDEFGIRWTRNILCLLIKKDITTERTDKIIEEITNYKWKLSNLKVEIKFELIENFCLNKINEIDILQSRF